MRRYSPNFSPPRRGYGGRPRSPPRGRYGGYGGRREPNTSLLVRNIPRDCRPEELRIAFERFGHLKDVYLPKDYYTGGVGIDTKAREPRGFGFVQFVDPQDAAEAQYQMDGQFIGGREITVVLAEENRKKPDEMRMRSRVRYGGRGYGRPRSPYYGRSRSRSRSPGYHPSSYRGGHHSRSSYSPEYRRGRDFSYSPQDKYRRSPSRSRDRDARSPVERRAYSSRARDGRAASTDNGHPRISGSRSHSGQRESRSPVAPRRRRDSESPKSRSMTRSRSRSRSVD